MKENLCCISSKEEFSQGIFHWKVLYKSTSKFGWFFMGVQEYPKARSEKSFNESGTFGILMTRKNGIVTFLSGVSDSKPKREVNISDNDVFTVALDCVKRKLTVSSKYWKEIVNLPHNGPWYPHFNTQGASFEIF